MELLAPAKINLSLKIVGRRADGYHLLDSLFVPVDLFDRLTIDSPAGDGEPGGEQIELTCSGADLPVDRGNLAWRAARAVLDATGSRTRIRIHLDKRIPLAAGLGGGSSDAASVLKGVNYLLGEPLARPELEELALGLGADVPFFIGCRPARAGGIGEILAPLRIPKYNYILINPGLEVPTAWAFSALGKALTEPGAADTISPVTIGSYEELSSLMNDLEPVVGKRWPVVQKMLDRLKETGAALARMSGSGPTVFGLFEDAEAARRAAGQLRLQAGWRVFSVRGMDGPR